MKLTALFVFFSLKGICSYVKAYTAKEDQNFIELSEKYNAMFRNSDCDAKLN